MAGLSGEASLARLSPKEPISSEFQRTELARIRQSPTANRKINLAQSTGSWDNQARMWMCSIHFVRLGESKAIIPYTSSPMVYLVKLPSEVLHKSVPSPANDFAGTKSLNPAFVGPALAYPALAGLIQSPQATLQVLVQFLIA